MIRPQTWTAVNAVLSLLFVMVWLTAVETSASSKKEPIGFDSAPFLYEEIDFEGHEKPEYDIFLHALTGYYHLRDTKRLSEKELVTLIDFRKSGNEKRLWVIDLKSKKLLYHSLVAHGRNSGELYAEKFSNAPESYQSSLGFFVTGNTYVGKHGVSLKLHGIENGINDKAETRAIVMHGAEYVSESFIKKTGRLGRSHGCPAVPMDIYKELIELLSGKTCLFIFYPDKEYFSKTKFTSGNESNLLFSANQKITEKRY